MSYHAQATRRILDGDLRKTGCRRSQAWPSRVAWLSVLALVLGALLTVAPGQARADLSNVGSFGAVGSGLGEFDHPGRVAVQPSTGLVFVVDTGGHRIDVFAPSGVGATPLTDFGSADLTHPVGIAVDDASGAVYVSDSGSGRIVKFKSDGAPTPTYTVDTVTFVSPTDVANFAAPLAVDQTTHDLLVADPGNKRIGRYAATGGVALGTFNGADAPERPFDGLLDIAVDSTGDVIVVEAPGTLVDVINDAATSRVLRFSSSGVYEATIGPVTAPGLVAVDPANDDVVVGAGFDSWSTSALPQIATFASDGTAIATADLPAQTLWGILGGIAAGSSAHHRVYAISAVNPIDDFSGAVGGFVFEQALPPLATATAATAIGAGQATLNGTVNPQGYETGWHFEYTADGTTWLTAPTSDAAAGAGTAPVGVSRSITGLAPHTTYTMRLVATNAAGTTTSSETSFTTDAVPPAVTTLRPGPRTATTAVLGGQVNPQNSHTTYHIEYGATTAYGMRWPATGEADAGASGTSVARATKIAGLVPAATYHYRIVAANGAGTAHGGDEQVTTLGTGATEDGRVYEQVTPLDKNGFSATASRSQVAPDGNGFAFNTNAAFPGAARNYVFNVYYSSRTDDAWTTKTMLPPVGLASPSTAGQPAPFLDGGFSADGKAAIFKTVEQLDSADVNVPTNVFTRNRNADSYRFTADGAVSWVTAGARTANESAVSGRGVFGFTPDQKYIVFNAMDELDPSHPLGATPGASTYGNLYLRGPDGRPRLVNLLPSGTVDPAGAWLGSYEPSPTGWNKDAIRPDGSQVIFMSYDTDHGIATKQIYLRDLAQGRTTLVSKGNDGPRLPPARQVRYLGAQWGTSPGEGTIYFSVKAKLAANAPDDAPAVYSYDLATDRVTYLVPAMFNFGTGGTTVEACQGATGFDPCSGVFGIAARGEAARGAVIYFASSVSLVPGKSVAGRTNLYVYDTTQQATTWIATAGDVLGEDQFNQTNASFERGSLIDAGTDEPATTYAGRQAQITPDGSAIVFASRVQWTAFDNHGQSELYRYDRAEERLECVSCGDAAPVFGATFGAENSIYAGYDIKPTNPAAPSHQITDDGRYVFFNTRDALVATDHNGANDAYMWHDGKLSLLTSGDAGTTSYFVGATADAHDVFINTPERLVRQDKDDLFDVYDARIGGGIASQNALDPVACSGDQCQGDPAARTAPPSLASAELRGPGDVATARPARFKVARITAQQQAALMQGKRVSIAWQVDRAATLRVVGTATVGRKKLTAFKASARLQKAGKGHVGIKLTRSSVVALRRAGRLRVVMTSTLSGAKARQRQVLDLRRASKRTGRGAAALSADKRKAR